MRTASSFPIGKSRIGGVVEGGIRLLNKVYPEPRSERMGLGQGCLEHIKSLEIRGLYLYWMSTFQEFV